jgi:hypothetical protein
MAHLHNLNPTLHLLGKKLSAKFKPNAELSSLEDALRRLDKAEAQCEARQARTWLNEEGANQSPASPQASHGHFLNCR